MNPAGPPKNELNDSVFLCDLLPEWNRAEDEVVMLQVLRGYFDDSADEQRKRFSAVGGLIGPSGAWFEFDTNWSVATYDLKGPFHSTDCDCNPPRGVFAGWKKDKCDGLMKTLIKIIHSSKLMGYGSIVPIPEYRSIFPGSDEYDPYFLALKHTIINMAHIASNANDDPELARRGSVRVSIVHEDGPTSARAYQIYTELKSVSSWPDAQNLIGFTHADKNLCALQGADLIAREAFKHADNTGLRPTRRPVKSLKRRIAFHIWNRPCLEYLKAHGGPNNLEVLTDWVDKELSAPRNR